MEALCNWDLYALLFVEYPDKKVHGAYMGPTWGRQDPGGPHVGPMTFAIRVPTCGSTHKRKYHKDTHLPFNTVRPRQKFNEWKFLYFYHNLTTQAKSHHLNQWWHRFLTNARYLFCSLVPKKLIIIDFISPKPTIPYAMHPYQSTLYG